jgi:Lipocalin-like domain
LSIPQALDENNQIVLCIAHRYALLMTQHKPLTFTVSLLLLAVATFTGRATAQKTAKEQLVGTWTLVLVDNVLPDGSRVQLYGPNPQGIAMFDASGRYSMQIMRDGRPKFAANDKSKGTPEEYEAAVQGSNCHFGTYTVNETDHTVTFHIEHATFPNWEGTERISPFTLIGDEFKVIIAHPTTGGPNVTGEVVWKRIH